MTKKPVECVLSNIKGGRNKYFPSFKIKNRESVKRIIKNCIFANLKNGVKKLEENG
jgi:hypothetical protein